MSTFAADSAFWIREEKKNHIKELFEKHSSSFPKIKKELGFAALSSADISTVPWSLYVMALSKSLIPNSEPTFPALSEFTSSDDGRIACNICSIIFKADEKDSTGMSVSQNVHGLYKLHKSVNHMIEYPLCLACFYALQNPLTSSDYPKNKRKDPNSVEYYTHTFQMLKRESDFGYLGNVEIVGSGHISGYVVPQHALCSDHDLYDPDTLNMDDYAH